MFTPKSFLTPHGITSIFTPHKFLLKCLLSHGLRKKCKKWFWGENLINFILPRNFVWLCSKARENPMRSAKYEIFETLSCLDDLSKCASMHVVTRFIAIVRFPMLFESSHCSKLKFSKTINHFWIYSRLHLKSDLTAFETFSWIWYCIFSIFLTKSVSASMLRAVRSAKWETKANNRGGFSWTWSSETKFSNDIPPDPFDVMRELIRSTNNEC